MLSQILLGLGAAAAIPSLSGSGSNLQTLKKRTTPSGTYAPSNVTCPDFDLVRNASSLSANETAWIAERKNITRPILEQWLSRTNVSDYQNLIGNGYVPNLALAFSGGGYRAMLDGAGKLNAFDWRTEAANDTGNVGGLFQAANYIAGLSGGSWLVGGLAINGNPRVFDMWHSIWNLDEGILNPGGLDVFETIAYYDDIKDQVEDKSDAGFNVTITDIWGRALAMHLINDTLYGADGGPAATWTDIQNRTAFMNHSVPFPIIIADQRSPGTTAIPTNTSNFEMNPYEFGSFDEAVFAFTPIQYLGSDLDNGSPVVPGVCVAGFDDASFMMGTSASLFNGALLELNGTESSILVDFAESILTDLSSDMVDIASYPNPFYNIPNTQGEQSEELTLVDGGLDGQNIPLNPLLQPIREIDVIIASDSSADTDYYWPNGTSLVSSYERYMSLQGNNTAFVYVPDAQTFVNLGLNSRPTFFGCNASNVTAGINVPPLIVYLPNAPITALSNTSTYMLEYDDSQVSDILTNGWNVATRGNGTLDASWPTCLGCAITQRQRESAGLAIPSECEACFSRYCWDGTLNTTVSGTYSPDIVITAPSTTSDCGIIDSLLNRNGC